MEDLKLIVKDAGNILIAGHRRPDGDCTGACIAAYHYLKENCPEKELTVYLEVMPEKFSFLDEEKDGCGGIRTAAVLCQRRVSSRTII